MNENETLTTSLSNRTIRPPSLSDVDFSFAFQFWFNLPFHVLSLFCYVFVLSYILKNKTQRQALHNHSIIVLLFISFSIVLFDYSWVLDSARHEGQVWLASPILCKIWWLLDFGFYDACTVVLAWTSFERHILIFHTNLIATKRRLILIHYLPLISIVVYLIIFYTYVIFFPSCENEYDFTSSICGAYPCYLLLPYVAQWGLIVNGVAPTLLIVLFNIALLVRVLWQKYQRRQDWRRCRRMAFQLLSISILYLSMNLPLMIIALVQASGYPDWNVQAQLYLFFFCAYIQYLLPFICLTCLPGIWLKMKIFFRGNHRRITPVETIQATLNRR